MSLPTLNIPTQNRNKEDREKVEPTSRINSLTSARKVEQNDDTQPCHHAAPHSTVHDVHRGLCGGVKARKLRLADAEMELGSTLIVGNQAGWVTGILQSHSHAGMLKQLIYNHE